MKTKWVSKVVTGSFAIALIFGSATFASAKDKPAVDHHKSENQKYNDQDENKKADQQTEREHGKSSEDKHSKGKSTDKKEKKKIAINSKIGKSIEKRIHSSETSIHTITKSINSFFGVADDGLTTEKVLSKTTATHQYKSYEGKLRAEINKLRAIDKQLSDYKKKQKAAAQELDVLSTKSKELQQLAADEIKRVKSFIQEATSPNQGDGTTTGETTQPSDPVDPATPTVPTDPTAPTDQAGDSAQ